MKYISLVIFKNDKVQLKVYIDRIKNHGNKINTTEIPN